MICRMSNNLSKLSESRYIKFKNNSNNHYINRNGTSDRVPSLMHPTLVVQIVEIQLKM